jgi:hypothetical protein
MEKEKGKWIDGGSVVEPCRTGGCRGEVVQDALVGYVILNGTCA